MAAIGSSGSITSPDPEIRNVCPRVGHNEQRLEIAQHLVGAPILGQFDGGAIQVAGVLLQLGFEAREKRECIGGRSGETGENLVLIEAANLAWRSASARDRPS